MLKLTDITTHFLDASAHNRQFEILESLGEIEEIRDRIDRLCSMQLFDPEGKPLIPDEEILTMLQESGHQLRECVERGFLRTSLPIDRQLEILEAFVEDAAEANEWRKDAEAAASQENVEDLSKAQWATVATTPPVVFEYDSHAAALEKEFELHQLGVDCRVDDNKITVCGCRVSFAFHKKMCAYKARCGAGCRFCMLPAGNIASRNITPDQQVAALDDALERTSKLSNQRTVLEILPDGSFLHKGEVPEKTRVGMMQRVAREPSIQKVAVETRPEYCDPDVVKQLLANLRDDQKLEIYFGLETVDEFIASVIHNKGYGFKEFKDAVRTLLGALDEDERARLNISVYNIIKPVYLTEEESLDASMQMAEAVNEFSAEVGLPIEVKYEPSVVSKGSFQDYLYHQRDEQSQRRFKPLSYFSVAELIARLSRKGLHNKAKFGQRDDIDNFSVVSMIPQIDDPSMFSQFDFMVYNAVQRFNATRDMRGFLVDMRIAVENAPEFTAWEEEVCGGAGQSELSKLIRESFEATPMTTGETGRENFQKRVWKVCDDIEYSADLSDIARLSYENAESAISQEIETMFDEAGIEVFSVKNFIFIDPDFMRVMDDIIPRDDVHPQLFGHTKQAAYQVEVIILNEAGAPQSIWVKVPLMPAEIPDRPDFIYGEDA